MPAGALQSRAPRLREQRRGQACSGDSCRERGEPPPLRFEGVDARLAEAARLGLGGFDEKNPGAGP
jgi:hypothetical protein